MRARLAVAIFSTLVQESAIAVLVLWALPKIGVQVPLPILVCLMIVWGAWSVWLYRTGSRALRRKILTRLTNMVGSSGEVVNALAPEGLVKIGGELWAARSAGGEIGPGVKVVVVAQNGLTLIVGVSGSDHGSRLS